MKTKMSASQFELKKEIKMSGTIHNCRKKHFIAQEV